MVRAAGDVRGSESTGGGKEGEEKKEGLRERHDGRSAWALRSGSVREGTYRRSEEACKQGI